MTTTPPARTRFLLALDTSTTTARVALVERDGGARRAAREAVSERHSSNLLALVSGVLEDAGAALGDVAAIACGGGPGSFTGLRVGLAVAKGLALPTGIPLVLVSSLEALAVDLASGAAGAAAGEVLVPCLDAGKGEIYAALYERDAASGAVTGMAGGGAGSGEEPWRIAPAELVARLPPERAAVLGGAGAARYREVLVPTAPTAPSLQSPAAAGPSARIVDTPGPTADAVARLGIARLDRGDTDDLATAVPRYGRPPDITRPKRTGP